MFNWLLRKIYKRKNRFLKVYCIHCCAQVDLIESSMNWLSWKRVMLTPGWIINWQLKRSEYTLERLEASRQNILKIIEEYKTKNQV